MCRSLKLSLCHFPSYHTLSSDSLWAPHPPQPGACRWAEPSGNFISHAAPKIKLERVDTHTHTLSHTYTHTQMSIYIYIYIHKNIYSACSACYSASFKLDAKELHPELVTGLDVGPCIVCFNTAPLFSGSTKPPLLTLNCSTKHKMSRLFLLIRFLLTVFCDPTRVPRSRKQGKLKQSQCCF